MTSSCALLPLVAVVALYALEYATALTPRFGTEVVFGEWGRVPSMSTLAPPLRSDRLEWDGGWDYAAQQRVVDAALDVCRGSAMEPDCLRVAWTLVRSESSTNHHVVDILAFGEWDTLDGFVAMDQPMDGGHLELCAIVDGQDFVCRPNIADPVRATMRQPTLRTSYETMCTRAPACACALGVDVDDTCNHVACPGGCSGHGTCHDVWGTCVCEGGFFGSRCSSMCDRVGGNGRVCSGHGSCTPQGECACDEGWEPPLCDTCDAAHWGLSPDMNCGGVCPGEPGAECNAPFGTCSSEAGCVCAPGYNLDPRTGCTECLPTMVRNPQDPAACMSVQRCLKSKTDVLGMDPDTNLMCAFDAYHHIVAPCTEEEQGDRDGCMGSKNGEPCSGHGTCITQVESSSMRLDEFGVVFLENWSPDLLCVAFLVQDNTVRFMDIPGETGECTAKHLHYGPEELFGDASKTLFKLYTQFSRNLWVESADGDFAVVGFTTSPPTVVPSTDTDAFNLPCDDMLVGGSYNSGFGLCPRTGQLYRLASVSDGYNTWNVHYTMTLPEGTPVELWVSDQYDMVVRMESGRFAFQRTNSPKTITLSGTNYIDPDFIAGETLVANSARAWTHEYVTASGQWYYYNYYNYDELLHPRGADRVVTSVQRNRCIVYHSDTHSSVVHTPSMSLYWELIASSTTTLYTQIRAVVGDATKFVDVHEVKYSKYLVMLDTGRFLYVESGGLFGVIDPLDEFGVEAQLQLEPSKRRKHASAGGGGEEGSIVSRLGPSIQLDDSGLDRAMCMCNAGFTGQWCEVRRECDQVVGSFGCISGMSPAASTTMDVMASPLNTSLVESGALGIRPLGIPPGPSTRRASTRVVVIRQRDVELDIQGPLDAEVSGIRLTNSRMYTPVRAESLCRRAHPTARLIHHVDLSTMSPDDYAMMVEELASPSDGGAVPIDAFFWVRDTLPDGSWTYGAYGASLAAVKTYNDAFPSMVGNVVCAFDYNPALKGMGLHGRYFHTRNLDVFVDCKVSSWECATWRSASGLVSCSPLGSVTE